MKAADNSINKEAREALVEGFSTALTSHIPCLHADRCARRVSSSRTPTGMPGRVVSEAHTGRT